jgi:hypothetical protein
MDNLNAVLKKYEKFRFSEDTTEIAKEIITAIIADYKGFEFISHDIKKYVDLDDLIKELQTAQDMLK